MLQNFVVPQIASAADSLPSVADAHGSQYNKNVYMCLSIPFTTEVMDTKYSSVRYVVKKLYIIREIM
jgi:hypothetical protein